ncbi:MAG: exopolysaccharide Pel transporter PelG [Deltaproteobacteria bacterium]|jgi:uncharacterized membrane protein|uniref:Histidine kinase n=1 Tax=Candidatus Acidulodesulfobacterium acidiphilum TaxID=2597224 RepID=A0A520XDR7_9DELT|nr:exopolysaccharide Pel transporter PelG [Deltaproteobacteria bacterium]RZV39272.1 MAG: hypothetical protein EVJ48_04910 [Candidatus Acidulodesulfobacterium acidiphilum]
MAGIAFELRKKLGKKSLSSLIQTFAYSAFLSSGAWIISIFSIILASYIAEIILKNDKIVADFQTSITYLISLSLIFSGTFQFYISRFTADKIFTKEYKSILPNFLTAVLLNMIIAFIIYFPLSIYLFHSVSSFYTLLSLLSFVVLCGEWIAASMLTGLKSYNLIVYSFICGYALTIAIVYFLGHLGLDYLMFAFFAGQALIFVSMIVSIMNNYPSDKLFSFDFLKRKNIYFTLILTGFFYNAGLWIDKFMFWFSPLTGNNVFSHLRASVVYDAPVLLAYFSMMPGMAVFFLKLEGEFAGYYSAYYDTITEGKTLEDIYEAGNKMILSARSVFFDVIRIQAIADILIILTDNIIFDFLHISYIYIPLFHVLLLGTMLLQILLVLIGFMFYFDKRNFSLFITSLFFILNFIFTYISIQLGPYYYGYGFTLSLLVCVILGSIYIRRFLNEIHYFTYMFI